jgi:TonB-linked SusC/RagA family outer membrane protein
MKKILLMGWVVLLAINQVCGQERTVTGTVTSEEDGSPLPGVNVVVKGTSSGTVTDVAGKYSLAVPQEGGVLIFSFIGLVTQEVDIGERTVIDVRMAEDIRQLGEVVVTALGVERESRTLGYSVEKLDGSEIIQARNSSLLNSLQGKVAGVQVTNSSGAPGSSNKVIVRGFTSLSGGNNPLYIVDGVPVSNSFTGTESLDPINDDVLNGASDFGNRVNDINPEDIESVTVLKGAAASALYGSRAASGVILITTKKGKEAAARRRLGEVQFASSFMAESVLKLPTFQNERGQGFFGSTSSYLDENTSWGSEFDGQLHPWGRIVNNQQRVKPFVALPDNVKEFFEIGHNWTNSLSLQGGGDRAHYYFSYSNVDADGIFPTSADSYKRNTLSVRGSADITDRITSSASLNYARSDYSFVPTGQGGTVYNNLLQVPRDIPLLELEDIENPFNDLNGYFTQFASNPWYVLKKYGSESVIDRLFGNFQLTYKATDWLDFTARVGSDVSTTEWEQWVPKQVITGPNSGNSNPGNYSIQQIYYREFNSDVIANFNKDINSVLSFTGLIGWNVNQRRTQNIFTKINDLVIPEFYNIANTANTPQSRTDTRMRRLVGVYAQATLGYRDYAFLTISGRNDWSSTLPKGTQSFFYPSANLGIDLTSAFGLESNTLSYAKLRAGWAQVGKDAPPYLIESVFVPGAHSDGFINNLAPYSQAIPGFEVANTIGNPALQPEISTETEIGVDLRFFGNRLGLDATVYKRDIRDNIIEVPVAASSGYFEQVMNIAKLSNKGVEILLSATPVMTTDFHWEISLNWARNISRVEDLGGPTQISLGGLNGNELIARVGGPVFEIQGDLPMRDPQGRIIVNNAGLPIPTGAKQVIASTNYDWIGGVTNRICYKGLSLSGTFDVRQGGGMYSRTATLVYFAGTTPHTLYNDRKPFIIPNSVLQVVDFDGNPTGEYTENTTSINDTDGLLQTFWQNGGFDLDRSFIISKSFVKLREVVLSYQLPQALISRTPLTRVEISLIGRNLLLWVPEENIFIDPEATTFGTDIESEFGEYGAQPSTRSYGVNLRITL